MCWELCLELWGRWKNKIKFVLSNPLDSIWGERISAEGKVTKDTGVWKEVERPWPSQG